MLSQRGIQAPALMQEAGSLRLEANEFSQIARILYDRTGIILPEDNRSLVVSRLVKHIKRLNLSDFGAYIDWVSRPENRPDQDRMVSALTTNTTRFYREPYHFDIFAQLSVPRLKAMAEEGKRIRLWSAGCSSGEEPYSLAATLLHHWPTVLDHDVRILATDICESALECAREASYPRERLDPVPEDIRKIMLSEAGAGASVSMPKALRDLVSVRYMNFIEPWPAKGPFQVIFCRNVAIYMDDRVQSRIWHGMSDVLETGGILFIGHSERLPDSLNKQLELIDRTTFRRI